MARKIKWGVIGAGGIASRRTIPEWLAAGIDAIYRAVRERRTIEVETPIS